MNMIDADSNSVWTSCAVNVPVTVTPANVGVLPVLTPCTVPLPFSVVKSDSFVVTLVEREPLATSKVVVLVEKLALAAVNEPDISDAIWGLLSSKKYLLPSVFFVSAVLFPNGSFAGNFDGLPDGGKVDFGNVIIKKNNNLIISLGGGTPCYFDNIDFLNSFDETNIVCSQ